MVFNPHDVLAMVALADEDSDKDIVCGPYPKKCIAWERIAAAVEYGIPPDGNPASLEQYVGDFVFNPCWWRTKDGNRRTCRGA